MGEGSWCKHRSLSSSSENQHTCTCTHVHTHTHNLYLLHMHTHTCLQYAHTCTPMFTACAPPWPVIQSRYRCLEGKFMGALTRGTSCQDGHWNERQAGKSVVAGHAYLSLMCILTSSNFWPEIGILPLSSGSCCESRKNTPAWHKRSGNGSHMAMPQWCCPSWHSPSRKSQESVTCSRTGSSSPLERMALENWLQHSTCKPQHRGPDSQQ